MPQVFEERVMSVPLEALRRAILDFDKYPEFMPEVIRVSPEPSRTPHVQQVEFEIEVIKRFKYKLEFDLSDPAAIRWKLVESNLFTANEGAWVLEKVSDAQTRVKYELEVGVKFLVPKWVAKKLTEVNLPRLLDGMEARAKSLAG